MVGRPGTTTPTPPTPRLTSPPTSQSQRSGPASWSGSLSAHARRVRDRRARSASSVAAGYPTSSRVRPCGRDDRDGTGPARPPQQDAAGQPGPPGAVAPATGTHRRVRGPCGGRTRPRARPRRPALPPDSVLGHHRSTWSVRIVVAPSRGRQNGRKSCSPTNGATASPIAVHVEPAAGLEPEDVSRAAAGPAASRSSASRYRYRRHTAEKRASKPTGASAAERTTTSGGSTPARRRTSDSRSAGRATPGNASPGRPARRRRATTWPRACTPASVRPATVTRWPSAAAAAGRGPRSARPRRCAVPAGTPTRRTPYRRRRGPAGRGRARSLPRRRNRARQVSRH